MIIRAEGAAEVAIETTFCELTSSQLSKAVKDVMSHPSLRKWPRLQGRWETGSSDIYDLVLPGGTPSMVLLDREVAPRHFSDGMRVLVSALGTDSRGYALEDPRIYARTIIWVGSDADGQTMGVSRINPYGMTSSEPVIHSSRLSVSNTEEDPSVKLSRIASVNGEYFLPFKINDINVRRGSHYAGGIWDRLVESKATLADLISDRNYTEIHNLAVICHQASEFIWKFVNRERKRGWDALPAANH